MKICEIFESIQGEGIFSGMPALFVRLGTCNLDCEWCDTAYAREEFSEIRAEDVADKINNSMMNNVVITGGEPLLQAKEMLKLAGNLKKRLFLETNGTLYNEGILKRFYFISLSPKLSSSKNKKAMDINILKRYVKRFANKIQLKFVVCNKRDLMEMKDLLETLKIGKKIPVVVQPNGKDITDYSSYHRNPTTLDYRPEFARPSGSGRISGIQEKDNSFYSPHYRTELSFSLYMEKSGKLLNILLKSDLNKWDIRLMLQMHKLMGVK